MTKKGIEIHTLIGKRAALFELADKSRQLCFGVFIFSYGVDFLAVHLIYCLRGAQRGDLWVIAREFAIPCDYLLPKCDFLLPALICRSHGIRANLGLSLSCDDFDERGP